MKNIIFLSFLICLLIFACTEKTTNENSQNASMNMSEKEALFVLDDELNYTVLDKNGQPVLAPILKSNFFAQGEFTILWKDKNFFIAKQWKSNSICMAFENDAGLYAFRDNHNKTKYGFENFNKTVVIPASFDYVLPFSNGIAAVKKGDKWGYINSSGKAITDFLFDDANSFHGFVAIVEKNDKSFLIDSSFKKIMEIHSKYNIRELSSDVVVLEGFLPNKPSILISKSGSVLVDESRNYYKIYNESDSVIRVMKHKNGESLFGFINIKGEEIIPSIYEIAKDFVHGLAAVKTTKGWSLINKEGKAQFLFLEVENIEVVNDKTALLSKPNGKYSMLKIDTMKENELSYKKIALRHNPDLLVGEKEDGKKDLLNTEGETIFDHTFDKISAFQKQRAIVVFENKQQIIDDKGNVLKEFPKDTKIIFINKLTICE